MHAPIPKITKVEVRVWMEGGNRITWRIKRPANMSFSTEMLDQEEIFDEFGLVRPFRSRPAIDLLRWELTPGWTDRKGTVCEMYHQEGGGKRSDLPPFEVRPTITEWAVMMAETAATRGECTRRKVGAVVLDEDHRVVGVGYNGAAPGKPSCLEGACPRALSGVEPGSSYDTGEGACIAVHAEANALLDAGRAARRGELYVSTGICDGCLKLAKGARITWVHCRKSDGTIDSIPIR